MCDREIKVVGLGFALLRQDNETLASPDNRQRTTVGAAAGIMELRNYGSFAYTTRPWLRQTTRQRVNETTSRAVATCSLVVSWSRSLRSDSEAPAWVCC